MNYYSCKADIKKIRDLLEKIPNEIAEITYCDKDYEYAIDVAPKESIYCNFWIGFSRYGTYGLCFGHGLAFEDIDCIEVPVEDVVKAILAGQVRETKYTSLGVLTKVVGTIQLNDEEFLKDTNLMLFSFLNLFGYGTSDIKYARYPVGMNESSV